MVTLIDLQIEKELDAIKLEWKDQFKKIEKMQLSPDEEKKQIAGFNVAFDNLYRKYDSNEHTRQTFINFQQQLNSAIQKGKENYRHYENKQNLKRIKIIDSIVSKIAISISFIFQMFRETVDLFKKV